MLDAPVVDLAVVSLGRLGTPEVLDSLASLEVLLVLFFVGGLWFASHLALDSSSFKLGDVG